MNRMMFELLSGLAGNHRAHYEHPTPDDATVNQAYEVGFIEGDKNAPVLTEAGRAALEPYRVDNAVIMAAGMSSRFAPISYEFPKGLLKVKGEVLIERQIRQLREAGIDKICVVVGYKKELFYYLEEAFDVEIRVNEEYATRNNNSTLKLVEDLLANTYICSSDNYFTENVFEPYVYQSYYSLTYFAGETDEYVVTMDDAGIITSADGRGGRDMWGMLGHVYFDRDFSHTFTRVLNEDYKQPECAGKLWEDVYIDHMDELDFEGRKYADGIVLEFDSLDDLRNFDPLFIDNLDSQIFKNICSILGCETKDIVNIVPIKQGLTNLSFRFDVGDKSYVYRHPGHGTESIISREAETASQKVAQKLGIDTTFIHEDPKTGWKLSHFIDGCRDFDEMNPDDVAGALTLIRKLHTSGADTGFKSSLKDKIDGILDILDAAPKSVSGYADFTALRELAERVWLGVNEDGYADVLCHVDFYGPNVLCHDGAYDLIDWEYSAMCDFGSDLGTFIACSTYTDEQVDDFINQYFEGKTTERDRRHVIGYVGLSGWYWFIWALYKENQGDVLGEWTLIWYRWAKKYLKRYIELG